jgi:hypothetical protein
LAAVAPFLTSFASSLSIEVSSIEQGRDGAGNRRKSRQSFNNDL